MAEARQQYALAEDLYGLLGDRKGRAATLFQSLDDARGQAVSAINLAWHAILQADYSTARDSATRGLELARAMNSSVYEAYALSNLGAAERELGELPAQAYAALQIKAEAIPDRESRATFLQMPFNRELLAAFQG